MKVTIIPADGAVYKDSVSYSGLTLVGIPENVHALQWNGVKGWIEYSEDDEGVKPTNQNITELPDWAVTALATWDAAAQESAQAEARAQELQQLAQQTATPVEVIG